MSAINKLQVLVILIMTEIGCNSDDERSQNKWLVWPWTWDVQWLIESVPADMLFYHWLNVKDLSSSSSSSWTPPNLERFLMLVRQQCWCLMWRENILIVTASTLTGSAASVTVWLCDSVGPVQLWQSHITLSHHTVTTWSTRDTTETSSPLARSHLCPVLWELNWWTCQHLKLWSLASSHWLRTELVKSCILCLVYPEIFHV